MAMDLERVRKVSMYYRGVMVSERARGLGSTPRAKEFPHLQVNGNAFALGFPQAHVLSMLDRLEGLIDEGRREKVMRWYGFVQGALWAMGLFSVEELKAHSNPDVEPPQ
jgi:hypothetical protein